MSTITIQPNHKLSLQSPNLALIAAGSTGQDGSLSGIHLRWTFGGTLAEKHLPKGDYATYAAYSNFNKPNDFVRIYKTYYQASPVTLNFANMAPDQVLHNEARWLYNLNGKHVYVKFMDKGKYYNVLSTIDPLTSPYPFILAYNDSLIEVECVNELFFFVTLFPVGGSTSPLDTETYSSQRGYMGTDLYTNSRGTYNGNDFSVRIPCENGRAVAYQGRAVYTIIFEFYMDFIRYSNNQNAWEIVGDYALSLDDQDVFKRLDPMYPGSIDNRWPRFVNGAKVNTLNYMDKWNGDFYSYYYDNSDQYNIKDAVKLYITLSEDPDNPSGIFNIPLTENVYDENDVMPVSLVSLLNAGARDFHVARMLGLGTMDPYGYPYGQFVYVAVYFTYSQLPEYPSSISIQHLSMSLPVGMADERLPLPVSIANIAPGMANDPSPDSTVATLTDANGYTTDGRSRFVTLIAKPLPDNQTKEPFYNTSTEFNLSESTLPVFAGLQYKGPSDSSWVKPELSHDTYYRNPEDYEGRVYNETIPITVDDLTNVIFLHCQKVSGLHTYQSYGINLFSRVRESGNAISINTNILPANFVKPPVNINALLVREESPLMLTSQLDQNRLAAITATDKTLVRLSFNYDDEIVIDKVEEEYDNYSNSALESTSSTVYPSNQDTYADEIEIYFRNTVPKNISGKVVSVADDPVNPLLSVINTGSYSLSNGETLVPAIPSTDVSKYIGGVFMLGNQQFIIQAITPSLTSPILKVLKKKVNPASLNDETISEEDHLQAPQLSTSDFLFMIIENMQ
ncbi:MAG: hypothetical protein LBL79_01445, partial [Prevotella sp.]|nr:hypothetical protein [Prevotella sp.]